MYGNYLNCNYLLFFDGENGNIVLFYDWMWSLYKRSSNVTVKYFDPTLVTFTILCNFLLLTEPLTSLCKL